MEEFKKNIKKFLPFLEDLRTRLYRGVILFGIVFLIGFLSSKIILGKILNFISIDNVVVATSSPLQFVGVAMNVGFFLAVIALVPYLIYSFYGFVMPALTRREKIKILTYTPLSVGLFVGGFVYGFFLLYYALGFLAAINANLGIANFWNIGQFLSQILVSSALLGLLFEFPIILSLLIKLGIVTPQALKSKRRIAYFVAFALAAFLPPTDGVTLLAMAVPLVLLYEGTILLNSINSKQSYAWIRT